MKKEYIMPAVELIEAETMTVLAASLGINGEETVGSEDILSRDNLFEDAF